MQFTIKDIEIKIREAIDETMEMYGLTEDEAITIFRHYKWNRDKITDALLTGVEGVKIESGAGLDMTDSPMPQAESLCQICYMEADTFDELKCGHTFCTFCW